MCLINNERIDMLYANNIKIIQSADVFSFSLDAVLLANFAAPPKNAAGRIVDLCAGNGAVALFLSTKTTGKITAVEIQARLCEMAQRSIKLNSLEQQITALNIDLADSFKYLKKDAYDTVTCNPPYFSDLPTSKKNENPYLAIARHEITVDLQKIIEVTSGLLKMNGKAFFVHRPERAGELFSLLQAQRLSPKRVQLVYPKQGREANMILVEAIKDGRPRGMRFLPPLVVYDDNNQYTPLLRKIIYGK
ncbi:tRNA1(Val) (adenine(37)-N6)-methyltransferase [Liquorilactobacillus satsumensis]|uniref:O-methyltransferase n=2 Tax=Liquorilactobacillus satsumensis TaxID=259059 RepID=A0A0R1V2R2_9LACO|nr:tRNA1(Val) (adenine(37)-N6)-methyltransferase [Liquorilactobacillus satsumensis]KRL98074.1 O-methyltransferase [Liquorilactobacillus satsumensis DSM 16230 = JCM 12392]MCC7665879.1 tRNA1(Val) (adenine(37)-N6)-methyltransferase [Liquorilactobacillus satsumensis]MCP9312161.1 tRNA1(Val) (adenine(37)-N6)-methyltransferase [Liquorilactobacillus satsumensis]MCP9327752.1 tRNA1(Val) (adenine(37)-N6)-methyltransferase [Liquorilactobacillus satsumensis]MCP9356586.1 tRNA1(Val) (adenine(37)-N6)-methyltr